MGWVIAGVVVLAIAIVVWRVNKRRPKWSSFAEGTSRDAQVGYDTMQTMNDRRGRDSGGNMSI